MITKENKDLARWALDYALKNGCQQVKVQLSTSSNTSFSLRDGRMDRLEQATENGLTLGLYVEGRYGTYTTNRLVKSELADFLQQGIEATRYLAIDEARVLPPLARCYKGGMPDLQVFDSTMLSLPEDSKVALAQLAAQEVSGTDQRIVSVESSYSESIGSAFVLASNGFEGEKKNSDCSVYASVCIRGEGEARPSGYWYDSATSYDKLQKEGLGKKALERALHKIGQRKVQSGNYTLVVDAQNAAQLLSPMLSAMYGQALQQKNSFLTDKLGKQVASEKLILRDEPHIIGAFGARYFDGEGVATQARSLFNKGVLDTYLIDTYHSKKLSMTPTISGPSVLVMQPGELSQEALVASVQRGILVTGFNGGNCNSSTGDFSYGVEGFLIENGQLTQPVSEMNITGNMLTLWNSLAAIGNNPRLNSSWRVPSLVFEDVAFSGF